MAVHSALSSCFTCVLELMSHGSTWCLLLMFYLCFRVDVSWAVHGACCLCFTCVLELMSHGSTQCLVLMVYLCFRVDVSWQYMVSGAHVLLVF